MLDRVFSAIVSLIFGMLLLQCLCALTTLVLHRLAGILGSFGTVLAVAVFSVGAAAKILGSLRGRDRRSVREHRAEQRHIRQSVRRPATDVPIEAEQVAPDTDPAINDEEEDES